MKHNNEKQYAGICMDNEKAMIITHIPGGEGSDYTIAHTLKAEQSHSTGSEHTLHNAKQTDTLKYYKAISALLIHFDEIFVFGPGKAQEQFQNHLLEDAQFKNKKISIDSAEHLTDPQMIAKVRDKFKAHQS